MPFEFKRMEIPDLIIIKPISFSDERGFFMETYKQSEFLLNGIGEHFVQDNFSHSVRGVLRGLHFQMAPKAQAKLVKVLRGSIYDVAVDVRPKSPTFGKWVGLELTSDEHEMFFIPSGFAHGFCVLSDEVDFVYKVSTEYASDMDRGIRWDDPDIGIDWPISDPLLSEKDANLPTLVDTNLNI